MARAYNRISVFASDRSMLTQCRSMLLTRDLADTHPYHNTLPAMDHAVPIRR
jgi:hypothetical protein